MHIRIRRRRFPVRIRRRKVAPLHGASLTGAEQQEGITWQEEFQQGEYPSSHPPRQHSPLLTDSDDDYTAEDDDEIVYTLAGPSYLASYSGDPSRNSLFFFEVSRNSFITGWDAVDYSDDHGAIIDEEPELLAGMGEDISREEYIGFLDVLPTASTPYVNTLLQLDTQQRVELHERHALYRIRARKLLQGKASIVGCLDDARLKKMYPPEKLKKKGYFRCYEQDGTFGWFFHPDHCQLAALNDYQRLVLIRHARYKEYMDWDAYRSCYYQTHELDREYVEYYEAMSREIRWIDGHVDLLDLACRDEWFKLSNRAARQAMKVATRFTGVSVGLAHLAFSEYMSTLRHHVCNCKDMDGVYFEIWKRFVKQQMGFRRALEEVYEANKFPLRQCMLSYELQRDCSEWEKDFRSGMGDIHGNVPEDAARRMITRRVRTMFMPPKRYDQYARKKLKIAELIGLIPKA